MGNRSNPETEVERLLRLSNAQLVRTKRHSVWKLVNGAIFTQACTPSDIHAADNQLRDLKRLLDLNGTRGLGGERRERKDRPGRDSNGIKIRPSANTAMLDALRKVGITEESLRVKIATLTVELRDQRRANHRKKVQLDQIGHHVKRCWGCKLRRFWRTVYGKLLRRIDFSLD